MDTPFYNDSMSGAFTPHHHPYPHRFHGDYERYPSSSGGGGKTAATPKKAITASPYFSGPAAGLGAASGGVKPNPLHGLPPPGPPASVVGQSLAPLSSSSSSASDADLLLVQATNHHGLAMTGHAPMVPGGGGGGGGHNPNPPGGHLLYRAAQQQQATNEQEGFADGFVKALADLHKQNQLIGGGGGGGGGGAPGTGGGGGVSGTGPGGTGGDDAPVYTNLSSYGAQSTHMQGYHHQVGYQGAAAAGGAAGGRDAAGPALQVVPHAPPLHVLPLHDSSSTPTLSPVDLETQERIKSERKKLRNRIAASKCRKRKLERIARLEDKVSLLKGFNGDLASTAAILKQEVEHLREKVRSHMTRGCQIIITGGGGGGGGGGRRGGEVVEKEEGNPSWGKKSKY